MPSQASRRPFGAIIRMTGSPASIIGISEALRSCGTLAVVTRDEGARLDVVEALLDAGAQYGGGVFPGDAPTAASATTARLRPVVVEIEGETEDEARALLTTVRIASPTILMAGRDNAGEPAVFAVAA